MGLIDLVEEMEKKNLERILDSTLKEKTVKIDKKVNVNDMNWDNPQFIKVKEKFEIMNTDSYWQGVVEKSCFIMNNFAGSDVEKKQLINKLLLEHEKYEVSFYTYRDIVQNPLRLNEALSKLKKALRNIDKKLAEYQDCQQSLFKE